MLHKKRKKKGFKATYVASDHDEGGYMDHQPK